MHSAFWRTLAAPLLLLALAVIGSAAPAAHAQTTLASSTFGTNADGWTVVDLPNATGLTVPIMQDGGPYTPTYNSNGGNPGGYISIVDPDNNLYFWYAPDKFLNDKSVAFGGTFSFDMRDTDAGGGLNAHDQSLILVGGGVTLAYTLAVPSTTAFTHYVIPLTSTGFTNLNTGKPASNADMLTVLGALDSIYILGDFEDGTDTGSLDNVAMTAAPNAAVSSLSLSPTLVTGGKASQGKVTLSAAAPAGGATIALKSSDTSLATVPTSVTIAAGNKSISFTVTTKTVTTTKTVNITASIGTTSKMATLTVNPAAVTVSALSLSPTSVVGGAATSTGTVTLSGAAPSGGLSVTLKSSNTAAATVATTLNIAAGAASAKFKVTTYAVTASTSVTLTATANGTSKTATLTVTAPSVTVKSLTLSPSTITGGQATTGTITLTAPAPSGGSAVTVSFSGGGGGTVTVAAGSTTATFTILTFTVTAKQTVTVSAALNGTTKTATLTVNPSSGSAHAVVPRTGGPVFTLPRQ